MHPRTHWAELFIGPQKMVVHGESDHEDDAGCLIHSPAKLRQRGFSRFLSTPPKGYSTMLLPSHIFFSLFAAVVAEKAENRLCSDQILYRWESLKQTPREHNSLGVI